MFLGSLFFFLIPLSWIWIFIGLMVVLNICLPDANSSSSVPDSHLPVDSLNKN